MSESKENRINRQNIRKGFQYLKRNGIKEAFFKAKERLDPDASITGYQEMFLKMRPNAETLSKQREEKYMHPYKFSILVPAYETEPAFLKEMIGSVVAQSYENWELCIADGSESDLVKNTVMEVTGAIEPHVAGKIRYRKLTENGGIALNTNAALEMATGEYVGMLDHDDVLEPDALYEIMQVLSANLCKDGNVYSNRIRAVYTDEDKIDPDGIRYYDPNFKPGFDIDLLRSNNYICHFFVIRTEIARKVGGFQEEFDGAQDHDFIFRCLENAPVSAVAHVPKVLYHWRCHEASTAINPESKRYAYEAGKRAVEAHLKRKGVRAKVEHTAHLGFFRVIYEPVPASVLRLTRKQWDAMDAEALSSIHEDYILILSEDLKPLHPDYLQELMGHLSRYEVGCVGGKIYGKRFRVESAGYTKDEAGKYVPNYSGLNGHYSGYMHRASLQQRVDGVSLDCMLLRKSALEIEGGKPRLASQYIVVFDPYAEFRRK
ncbi:MAG: glycosyltransferase [Lachnospiraceae bacterium]|nr:glycosyltransferase [Lachnospiraceae bacterium]